MLPVGTAVYGFAATAAPVTVTVGGGGGGGETYRTTPEPWIDTSGCNATACIDPKTPLPPHGGVSHCRQSAVRLHVSTFRFVFRFVCRSCAGKRRRCLRFD